MKTLFKTIFLVLFVSLSAKVGAHVVALTLVGEDGSPVAYAQCQVVQQSSGNLLQTVYTNEDGLASFNCAKDVLLNITAMGFSSYTDTLLFSTLTENKAIKITLIYDSIELEGVVISGQIGESNVTDALQVVNIISSEQIENQGAVNLEDVLSTQQNIRISLDPVLGSSASLTGLSGQNVKIMIDGVPVIGRQSGNIDLSQINLNNIERIEIIEGPMSVNYGSDALAGTINLISKKGFGRDSMNIKTSTYYESVGQYNFGLSGGKVFKNSSLKLEAGRNYFRGWSAEESSRFKSWKPKEQYYGLADYIFYLPKTEIRAKSEYFNEEIVNKGRERAPLFIQAFDDTYITNRISNSLNIKHPVKDGQINILSAYNYYKRRKNTYNTDLVTLSSELVPDNSAQDTTSFDLIMSRGSYERAKKASKIKYELGYDINRESGRGKRIKQNTQQITDVALFATLEYKLLKNLVVRPGMRYGYNSAYTPPLSPSFHVKWGDEKNNIRASYARGFRAPSLKDLYFDFVDVNHNIQGNPNLKAEYSHNYQFTYTTSKKWNKNLSTTSSIGGYYNSITNLITLAQVPETTQFSYENIDYFKTQGIRNNNTFSYQKTKIGLGFSVIGRYNELSSEENVNKFSYSPEVLLNTTHHFTKIGTHLSIYGKYQGELLGFFINEEEEVVQSTIGAFTTLDVSLKKSWLKNKLSTIVGVKNLLNVTAVNSVGETGAHSSSSTSTPVSYGRTFFTTLSLNLSK